MQTNTIRHKKVNSWWQCWALNKQCVSQSKLIFLAFQTLSLLVKNFKFDNDLILQLLILHSNKLLIIYIDSNKLSYKKLFQKTNSTLWADRWRCLSSLWRHCQGCCFSCSSMRSAASLCPSRWRSASRRTWWRKLAKLTRQWRNRVWRSEGKFFVKIKRS